VIHPSNDHIFLSHDRHTELIIGYTFITSGFPTCGSKHHMRSCAKASA